MKLLHQTYKNIVIAADIENIKSVAIPSISTGIYGFPPILAAGIAVDACRNAPLDITLVAFDDETLKLYQELI